VSWSVGAIALLLGAIPEPTAIGKAYLVVQALAVGVLAELQWLAVRRVSHGPYAASVAVPRA
jgi:hypothetical protein